MDLKAEARRLAEEATRKTRPASLELWKHSADVIESVLLAFGRLVREEDANVCDVLAASSDESYAGAACEGCAAALRAKSIDEVSQ